jgi:hypothetical protein
MSLRRFTVLTEQVVNISTDEVESEETLSHVVKNANNAYKAYVERRGEGWRPLLKRKGLSLILVDPQDKDNGWAYALHLFIWGQMFVKFANEAFPKDKYGERGYLRVFDMVKIHFSGGAIEDDNTDGIITINLDDFVSCTTVSHNSNIFQLSFDNLAKHTKEELFRRGVYWPTDNWKWLRVCQY